jgi:phospholipid transport system transporter-binding protein
MLKERLDLNVDLTFETAIEQRIRLHNFIKKFSTQNSENAIIINLSQVKRSDSAGLALMVDALRLGRSLRKKILFENIPEQMMSMICFCNLLPLFIQEK